MSFIFLIPFVCEKLKKMGFHHFVGVDGSMTMLELAKKTGLYQELKQCLLGHDEISVEAGNASLCFGLLLSKYNWFICISSLVMSVLM